MPRRKKKGKSRKTGGAAGKVSAPAPTAADVTSSSSAAAAPSPERNAECLSNGAHCWICLEEEPDDAGGTLMRNCACRGDSAGFAHTSCLAEYAASKSKEAERKIELTGRWNKHEYIKSWCNCPNCNQPYDGALLLALQKKHLESVMHLPDTDCRRYTVLANWALLQSEASDTEEVEKICLHLLSLNQSNVGNTPTRAGNFSFFNGGLPYSQYELEDVLLSVLGTYYARRGEEAKGLEFLERALEKATECFGPNSTDALTLKSHIDVLKGHLGMDQLPSDQIVEIARRDLAERIRVHGKEHIVSISGAMVLVKALETHCQYLEALELAKETMDISQRLLGQDHNETKYTKETLSRVEDEYRRRERAEALVTRKAMLHSLDPSHPGAVSGPVEVSGIIEKTNGFYKVTFYRDGETNTGGDFVPFRQLIFAAGTPVIGEGFGSARNLNGKDGTRNLNGKDGTILSYSSEKLRYAVTFEDGQASKKVLAKPENLKIVFST